MTCIVGLKSDDGIYIGGDSSLNCDDQVRTMTGTKVFRRGQFVIGYCGSIRIGQLIQFRMKIPPIKNKDLFKYMVVDFANAMRSCLNHAGAAKKSEEQEEQENQFIVGIRDRLFEIDSAYACFEVVDGCHAIGSGSEYALGSLISTGKLSSSERVKIALGAAAYFSSSVKAPFKILKVKVAKSKKDKNLSKSPSDKGDDHSQPIL